MLDEFCLQVEPTSHRFVLAEHTLDGLVTYFPKERKIRNIRMKHLTPPTIAVIRERANVTHGHNHNHRRIKLAPYRCCFRWWSAACKHITHGRRAPHSSMGNSFLQTGPRWNVMSGFIHSRISGKHVQLWTSMRSLRITASKLSSEDWQRVLLDRAGSLYTAVLQTNSSAKFKHLKAMKPYVPR